MRYVYIKNDKIYAIYDKKIDIANSVVFETDIIGEIAYVGGEIFAKKDTEESIARRNAKRFVTDLPLTEKTEKEINKILKLQQEKEILLQKQNVIAALIKNIDNKINSILQV